MSSDWSLKPEPVPYADFANPQTFNLYAIVSDDPESFADLDGHGGEGFVVTGPIITMPSTLRWNSDVIKSFINNTVIATVNLALQQVLPADKPAQIHELQVSSPSANAVGFGLTFVTPGGEDEAIADAASRMGANAEKGAAFEKKVVEATKVTDISVQEQVTLKTESGVRTRMDVVSTQPSGQIRLQEAKSSARAPLTDAQRAAHPEIEKSGATVVGKGKLGFPGGTQIPPTKVEVVRPPGDRPEP